LIGRIRGISQLISYEVSFISVILFLIHFNLNFCLRPYKYNFFGKLPFLVLIVFLICSLAELNRAPFDFAEGESELVSGFNTEFINLNFSIIFLTEYGRILFIAVFLKMIVNSLELTVIVLFFVIWVRTFLPRLRYDYLMYLN